MNPVNNRHIFRLLWPILIEQTLSSLVGFFDVLMVSHVSDAAVSAVGLVNTLNMMLINVFSAISAGATVVVSQRAGQKDREGIYKTIGQAAFVLFCIMVVISVMILFSGAQIFDFLHPDVDSAVRQNGLTYFQITAMSYPLVALYAILTGTMRGQGDVRTPMKVATIVNIINVSLNALMIYGMRLGVAGNAHATNIAWFVGALIMVSLTAKRNSRQIFSFANMRPKKHILFPVFRIGFPSGLDALLFHSGKIITQIFLAGMGTANISGMVIANSMFGLFCIPGNAFAIAVTTLVGQNYGAGLYRTARKMLLRCIGLATGLMTAISSVSYWLAPLLVSFYLPTPEAAPVAVAVLRSYLIMIPLIWPVAFVASNGLRAVNDVVYTTTVSVTSMWLMRVGCAWLLGVYWELGPLGISLAMGLDWLMRGAFYMPRILTLRRLKEDRPDRPPVFAKQKEAAEAASV